ncbi:MAG: adenylosuccinate synthase [Bryobacterales bacterium]|nr:adenylosuccinate synthase [Bryobacterales bacterium]
MSNLAVLGLQWGDEGKGKLIDLAAEHYDIVVRCQGGNNAGHTVQIGDKVYKLSLVPSGILWPGKTAVVGNGVVINPAAMLDEIDSLRRTGVRVESNLLISNRAHVVFPYHPLLERSSEATPGKRRIGTTSRGIGPCYEDKVARRGIRVAELLSREHFTKRFRVIAEERGAVARALGISEPWDSEGALEEYLECAERLRPFVTDTAKYLNDSIKQGKRLLFEGAQATMLDIDFGTYPYLTSSNASAGGLCTGSGVSPRLLHDIVGVAKAYATRVGEGPFATELHGPAGDALRDAGGEFGTVTGRPRRCGWFDIPLLRYAHAINHLSSLFITKLDVLDYLTTIPVCTGYRLRGAPLDWMPAIAEEYEEVEAVYEDLPGWNSPTRGVTSFDSLPQAAKDYIAFLEDRLEVEIGGVSTGPEREQTIVRDGSVLERVASTRGC